jgi:hypothetical protein
VGDVGLRRKRDPPAGESNGDMKAEVGEVTMTVLLPETFVETLGIVISYMRGVWSRRVVYV